MSRNFLITSVRKLFGFLSSLKTAIPLLVITVVVTIAGSLLPTPDFFRTWWYLGLLGSNGVSLLFVTILHIPMILERKGRNALIGVVATHLGILVLIAGVIYGGISGYRHEIRAIEGEVTIMPGLPFAIHLDELAVEKYEPGEVPNLDPEAIPMKRQESHLSFYIRGEVIAQATAAPGKPTTVDGFTVLPSFSEIGWVFEMVFIDNIRGHKKAVSVRPWLPSVINTGGSQVMVHGLKNTDEPSAQLFTLVDGQMTLLGLVKRDHPIEVNGSPVEMGEYKRYTGLTIYNRPHMPVLVAGCLVMLFGLVWHFYFRHRDRRSRE